MAGELKKWQENQDDSGALQDLQNVIEKASENGHGFRLKIKASVLQNSGPDSKAIDSEDVEKLGKVDGDLLVFDIPSKNGSISDKNRGVSLKATELRGSPSLLLRTKSSGVVGVFRPDEIESLDIN